MTQKKDYKLEDGYIPCSIKSLPDELQVAAAKKAKEVNPKNSPPVELLKAAIPGLVLEPEHLAVLTSRYWGEGGVRLTVKFMDTNDTALKAHILAHMNAWNQWANVQFVESNVNPQVRITRGAGGYWSYLGTDILSIPANQATMNLEGFSMATPESEFIRVVRHETGHTLGFPHEHLREEIINGIDREKAIAYFMRTQGWDRNKVISNVLTPIAQSALLSTAHADQNSIMCYGLPAEIMINHTSVPGGRDIDLQDQQFAALIYPKNPAGLYSSYFIWRGNGTAQINIADPRIRAGSTVLAAISEYRDNPRTSRFIGSARMAVYNIAPYAGGVRLWIEVSWGSPLPTVIDLLIKS